MAEISFLQWYIICVLAGVALIGIMVHYGDKYLMNNKRKKEENHNKQIKMENNNNATQPQLPMTKDLVMRTLRAIGCEPSVNDEDESRIDFQYQGGNFFMLTADGRLFTYLYFVWWYDAPLDNIDALSAIQKAVNNANCRNIGCNVMYTINQEENIIGVHNRCQMLFSPEISTLDDYLRAKLQELFEVRNNVVMAIRSDIGE